MIELGQNKLQKLPDGDWLLELGPYIVWDRFWLLLPRVVELWRMSR